MRFVFLGAPGVGKGTQGDLIVNKLNIPKISTGDILREAIKNKTEIGLKAEGYVKSGELVPDNIVYELVKERLLQDDVKKGFIFDGFPRNIEQAQFLDGALADFGMPIEKVINIHVDELELIKRLSSRRICRKCGHVYNLISSPPKTEGICDIDNGELYQRPDDEEEVITNSLEVYKKQTKPLIDYYSGKSILFNVEGSGNIDEINNDIEKILVS